MNRRKYNARRGFSLIELLLVLVILVVLAALVVPRFTGRTEQAKNTAATADIASLSNAIKMFEVDTGRMPSTDEGLGALMQPPGGASNWKGPYLDKMVNDPWGNQYLYRYPGQHNTSGFDLFSTGPDGRESDDDVVNWNK